MYPTFWGTYIGSQLKSEIGNTYDLVLAPNYYDFATEIVNQNLSGYGVFLKHSFVTRVIVNFGSNTCLSITPVQYTLPMQALY